MYLKFEKSNNTLIANLIGELDHHSAEEVRAKIDDRIERENAQRLTLNFGGVTFMDSSGIGVVVGRFKKMTSRGGALCVVDVSRGVNRVFELSGLFKIINHYRDVDEALKCI